jgi:hypothetical protein
LSINSKQEGYLMIDHRASPGLPEDVARKAGYDPRFCGEGKIFEAASLTCAHCKVSVVKNPLRDRERASCQKCGWHYICDFCAAAMALPDYDHKPFEKIAEEALKQASTITITPPSPVLFLPPT